MNIAYILPSLAQAGNVNVALDLVKLMMENGQECTVFYFDKAENEYDFPCETIQISMSDKFDFNKYDIVHSHSLRPDIYVFLHKPLYCRAKVICTIHNFVFEDLISDFGYIKGVIGGLIWQFSRLRFDKILVLSEIHKKYYKKWFWFKPIFVAYNSRVIDWSLDIDESDKSLFENLRNQGKKILGSTCRVTGRKGLDQIIKALPFLENVIYIIIGEGAGLSDLKALAREKNIESKVIFLGNKKNGYRYMPYFDVFCIPSHSEGFPLAMLEAASCGTAVLSSDIPVFKEIFTKTEVEICKENDIQDYVRGINHILSNKDAFSYNIKEKYMASYTPECFYKNHINIYQN